MLHDPKTVNRSDFDQETAEKIAPQSIARLDLANVFSINVVLIFALHGDDYLLSHIQIYLFNSFQKG